MWRYRDENGGDRQESNGDRQESNGNRLLVFILV
jgi:hypothetical protein